MGWPLLVAPQVCCPALAISAGGLGIGSDGARIPYSPLTGDNQRSYSRLAMLRSTVLFAKLPGIGFGVPPSQLTYAYEPGLMMKVRAHTSTRTRNRMVKAVGNLKPRFGLSGAWVAGGAEVLGATSVPARGRRAAAGVSCRDHRRGPCPARSADAVSWRWRAPAL